MPFGFHLAMDTLPSGELQVLGFRSALACVRLSLSCPFKLLHTFHLPRPTRHYPRLRIQRSSFERRRDFNPPEQRAAQRTLRSDPTPPARTCPQYGIKPFQTGLSVRQARWRSPGSRACCFSACAGSQTTQGQLAARDSATSRVAFPARETVGVPGSILFRSSIARGPPMPLSTLRLTPRGVNRKTQGQDGVRSLLSCGALSSPTTCRFSPAHPQRRIRVSPRVDYQLTPADTLSIRYAFSDADIEHSGVGGFNLVSSGIHNHGTDHTAQIANTLILGANALNETRFQFYRAGISSVSEDTTPRL